MPAREHAAARGIELLTETANPLFAYTHFLHTFQDTVDVATAAELGVCLDLHPTWHERDIVAKIRAAAGSIRLVQVSDFVPGNMTVARDVVGDGVVPIERLLGTVLKAGYEGTIDLELFGRPVDTALDDTLRSLDRLSMILDRLGA